jgi:hypothetical protein
MLEMALNGLRAERARLDEEIQEIKRELGQSGGTGGTTQSSSAGSASPAKKTMSAAARKKISEGMKRRYAELRKAAKK